MSLIQKDLFNSPYAGVFCATNDSLTLAPPGIPKDDLVDIEIALGTSVKTVTIGGSRVLGTLLAMNNNGILVSNIVSSIEMEKLQSLASSFNLALGLLSERSNAIGNNFLVNDSGGVCNERLTTKSVEIAQDILGIKLVPKSLNNIDTVGMVCSVTNKGGICHPEIVNTEKALIEDSMQIKTMEGTVNFGMPLLGAGIIASSQGAVCGRQSTGVELGRVEEALKLF